MARKGRGGGSGGGVGLGSNAAGTMAAVTDMRRGVVVVDGWVVVGGLYIYIQVPRGSAAPKNRPAGAKLRTG